MKVDSKGQEIQCLLLAGGRAVAVVEAILCSRSVLAELGG